MCTFSIFQGARKPSSLPAIDLGMDFSALPAPSSIDEAERLLALRRNNEKLIQEQLQNRKLYLECCALADASKIDISHWAVPM